MELETKNNDKSTETPKTTPLSQLNQVTPVSRYLALILFIALPFLGGWIGYTYAPTTEILVEKVVMLETKVTKEPSNRLPAGQDLEALFNLQAKAPDTALFYSQTLGVGFTYEPFVLTNTNEPPKEVVVSEAGNIISLYIAEFGTSSAQTIEVFEKNSTSTIEEALAGKFLAGHLPENCFVVTYEKKSLSAEYLYFGISYPPAKNPNGPFWENIDKCPTKYSEINAVRYFTYNPKVTNKYIFTSLGQAGITTNGGSGDWSESIRIFE